jgi:transcriptional regulator
MDQVAFRKGWADFWRFCGSVCRLFEEWGSEQLEAHVPVQSHGDDGDDRVDGVRVIETVIGTVRDLDDDGADIGEAVVCFGDLLLDTRTRDVRRGVRSIELTPTEFRLLELFLRNPRQVLTRAVIYDRVWGFDFGPRSNTLSVYVGYLRRKTEADGEPRLIHTIRGIGYMLHK